MNYRHPVRHPRVQFAPMLKRASGGIVFALVPILALADNSTPPCTCGTNASHYMDRLNNQRKPRRKDPEPAWCRDAGGALLDAVYGKTQKVPPGFKGNVATDFDRVVSVYWLARPSAPRIVGWYRMSETLEHAVNIEDARRKVDDFFNHGLGRERSYPFLADRTIVEQKERGFFFEFLLPSEIRGKSVAFRVWKSSFLVPTVGWLLADADRTGTMTIVTMPVASLSKGDFGVDDQAFQYVWTVRVNRRSGEVVRAISPDIVCMGKHNPGVAVSP